MGICFFAFEVGSQLIFPLPPLAPASSALKLVKRCLCPMLGGPCDDLAISKPVRASHRFALQFQLWNNYFMRAGQKFRTRAWKC